MWKPSPPCAASAIIFTSNRPTYGLLNEIVLNTEALAFRTVFLPLLRGLQDRIQFAAAIKDDRTSVNPVDWSRSPGSGPEATSLLAGRGKTATAWISSSC